MKILLVEDNEKMAELVFKGLSRDGFEIETVHNGYDALNAIRKSSYDIVLLDVVMPGLTGIEVCRKVRDLNIEIPIIMLSTKGDIDDKVKGLDIGADDYLPKPFSIVELKARMRAAMRRKNPYTKPVLEVGDIIMDVNREVVLKGGKPINLSEKEYKLLEYFIRHKGEIITKDELMKGVWGLPNKMMSNVLHVHVSHLRHKIGDDEVQRIIQTVRGKGYLMKDR